MRFKLFIIRTLELKPEEFPKFLLLFFHSFFLGMFIAFYFVPANSMFIHYFGYNHLPIAYIASGAVGYLSTLLYSWLQKRVSALNLFIVALLLMIVVTITGRIGLYYIEYFDEKWLSFFVFIWAWPFISLVGIESGGLAIRMLNLRQVKRLFSLINIGGVIASILGYLAIPFLMNFFSHSYDLLYVGVSGIFISLAILFIINKQFPDTITKRIKEHVEASTLRFKNLMKERYFFLIFASATLSMTVIYFTDFGFLASIKAQSKLLDSPEVVSRFMAVVFGILKIGELVMSYFSSRILSKYGVKLGLIILPITSTVLVSLAAITGLLSSAQSILFFGFIILNKCFERILRRSLDDPSFNVLYQPLPEDRKLSIQTKVGVIMQLSIGIAGVVLLLSNELLRNEEGYQLKYFPLIFLPILVAWSSVALRLYNSYKQRIRQILKEKNQQKEKDREVYGIEVLEKKLKSKDINMVEMSVAFLSETNPRALELYGVELLKTENQTISKSILRNINPTYRQEFKYPIKSLIEKNDNDEIKILSKQALNYLDYGGVSKLKPSNIEKLIESKAPEDKFTLIKYVYLKHSALDELIISHLLDHENKVIKRSAIKLAGKRDISSLHKKLIRLLKIPEYSHIVSSTLLEIGERVTDELDNLFKKDTPTEILLKVIEIYAKIASPKTKSLLVSHLDYESREIQLEVIRALYYAGYQVNVKERNAIKKKLEEVVENILWAMVAINDLESEKNTLKLIQAIDLEREENMEILFNLLSFIFKPTTIDLIKKNIIGENTIFALEIIENFISQDIKQLIIPLFERISITQRMKRLHSYFPMQRMKFTDRLKDIIIRDYNKVDFWTRTKAIELLGRLHRRKKKTDVKADETNYETKTYLWTRDEVMELLAQIRKSEMPDEIFACLYHSDELVYSTAAKIIYDENPIRCVNYLKRLPRHKQELIDMLKNQDEKNLLNERVKLIKRVPLFFNIPENILVKLVKIFKTRLVPKKETITFEDDNGEENIFIVLRGKLMYEHDGEEEIIFVKNDIIIKGHNIRYDANHLTAKMNALVLKGSRYEYFNRMVDEIDIVKHLFQVMSK